MKRKQFIFNFWLAGAWLAVSFVRCCVLLLLWAAPGADDDGWLAITVSCLQVGFNTLLATRHGH